MFVLDFGGPGGYEPDLYGPAFGAATLAFVVIMLIFEVLIAAGVYVLCAWFLSRVFDKAGIPRWKAWVPFVNGWTLLELGRQPGWLIILSVVPVANIVALVFLCIAAYNVGLGFGKSGAWVVLFLFLPYVWVAILGFDSSVWQPWRVPGPGAPYGYMPPPGYGPPQGPPSGYGPPPQGPPPQGPPPQGPPPSR